MQRKKLAHHAYRTGVLLLIAVASAAVVLFLNGAVVNLSALSEIDLTNKPEKRQSYELASKSSTQAHPDLTCESKQNRYLVPVDFGGVKVDLSADCGGYSITRKR